MYDLLSIVGVVATCKTPEKVNNETYPESSPSAAAIAISEQLCQLAWHMSLSHITDSSLILSCALSVIHLLQPFLHLM